MEGLKYEDNFISEDREKEIVCWLDKQEWSNELSRRVQHYGYKYDYISRKLTHNLGEIPKVLRDLAKNVYDEKFIDEMPDQIIVNEYLPGQGINAHIDAPVFGDYICTLSLISKTQMIFVDKKRTETHTLTLEPRSLLSISGKARWRYTHQIVGRLTDMINGKRVYRERRISITFRKVKKTLRKI